MSLEKAVLTNTVTGLAIPVQFNPADYTLARDHNYAQAAIPGLSAPILQFVNGNLQTLEMELFLDSYEQHKLGSTVVNTAQSDVRELVRRILSVLSSGRAKIEQLVAVTFTEKAAGELKLRIRKELEGLRQRSVEPTVLANLTDAIQRLEEAHVSTIHGFCADLLRERPVEASIDPLFEVLTEPRADRLFGEAFGSWLHEKLEEPPEGLRRALRRSVWSKDPRGDDDGPVDRIRRAARFSRTCFSSSPIPSSGTCSRSAAPIDVTSIRRHRPPAWTTGWPRSSRSGTRSWRIAVRPRAISPLRLRTPCRPLPAATAEPRTPPTSPGCPWNRPARKGSS